MEELFSSLSPFVYTQREDGEREIRIKIFDFFLLLSSSYSSASAAAAAVVDGFLGASLTYWPYYIFAVKHGIHFSFTVFLFFLSPKFCFGGNEKILMNLFFLNFV